MISREIPGIETIRGLVGEPPREIKIPFKLMLDLETSRPSWNACFVAIIPYCFRCRELLVWHSPPEKDGTLFHCPKCSRRWIKGDQWEEDKATVYSKLYGKLHEKETDGVQRL